MDFEYKDLEKDVVSDWNSHINDRFSENFNVFANVVSQLYKYAIQQEITLYEVQENNIRFPKDKKILKELYDFFEEEGWEKLICDESSFKATNRRTIYNIEGGIFFLSLNRLPKDFVYISFGIATFSKEIKEKVGKFILDFKRRYENKTEEKGSEIYFLTCVNGQYNFQNITNKNQPLIEENYNPKVVEDYEFISKELVKPELSGRLVILEGVPGTGKTHIIKSLTRDIKGNRFVIIPSQYVGSLASPDMISSLLNFIENFDNEVYDMATDTYIEIENNSRVIFIVEDADSVLEKRDRGNNDLISTLLNFADGIMGTALDVAFICSTNTHFEYDEAVLRSGRLLRKIDVGPLSVEQASKCYFNLTNKEFDFKEEIPLSEIYALVLHGKKPKHNNKKKVGF